jgi:hypothetical protein
MMHLQQKYAANTAAVRYSLNIALERLLLMDMDFYKKGSNTVTERFCNILAEGCIICIVTEAIL